MLVFVCLPTAVTLLAAHQYQPNCLCRTASSTPAWIPLPYSGQTSHHHFTIIFTFALAVVRLWVISVYCFWFGRMFYCVNLSNSGDEGTQSTLQPTIDFIHMIEFLHLRRFQTILIGIAQPKKLFQVGHSGKLKNI